MRAWQDYQALFLFNFFEVFKMGVFRKFSLNEIVWVVEYVPASSEMLVDRTNHKTVATTDPATHTVYLSEKLQGPFLVKVLLHELGHCVMISYDLLGYIHDTVYPDKWVEAEEWMCNFISDYGFKIFSAAYKIVGEDAWRFVVSELEKAVA